MTENSQVHDVVEVVRCKHCEHWDEFDMYRGYCYRWHENTTADEFCARGDREAE